VREQSGTERINKHGLQLHGTFRELGEAKWCEPIRHLAESSAKLNFGWTVAPKRHVLRAYGWPKFVISGAFSLLLSLGGQRKNEKT